LHTGRAPTTSAGPTWIGLFRGINVGGRNLLPMKELVALLAEEGFDEARTYIQSGNVVFRGAGTARAIGDRIVAAVARRFGFRPHLLLMSGADLTHPQPRTPIRRRAPNRNTWPRRASDARGSQHARKACSVCRRRHATGAR
jgi:uncharacterized protein (DUF1697 family)